MFFVFVKFCFYVYISWSYQSHSVTELSSIKSLFFISFIILPRRIQRLDNFIDLISRCTECKLYSLRETLTKVLEHAFT